MKFIVLLVCSFWLLGCREHLCENSVQILSHENDNYRRIIVTDCNDTTEKKCITFFLNGDTQEVFQMKHGKANGFYISFYPENHSSIKVEGVLKDDSLHGKWNYYTISGQLKISKSYENGKLRDAIQFDQTGKIQIYQHYNLVTEKLEYERMYNSDGSVRVSKGNYLGAVVANKKILYNGDSLIYYFDLARPPFDSIDGGVSFARSGEKIHFSPIDKKEFTAAYSNIQLDSGWLKTVFNIKIFINKTNDTTIVSGRDKIFCM